MWSLSVLEVFALAILGSDLFTEVQGSSCTRIVGRTGFLFCNGQTKDICSTHLKSWKVSTLPHRRVLTLSSCKRGDVSLKTRLLLFVSCANSAATYGNYDQVNVAAVKQVGGGCVVTLRKPTTLKLSSGSKVCLIAQQFPKFQEVKLRNRCVLTCKRQANGLGGILAFESKLLDIDRTSRIDVTGQGFVGGAPGDSRGGGGYGGKTFKCSLPRLMGKGGDINARWATNTNGVGSGGAGDGPGTRRGSQGGNGGPNAGGGGGDSRVNSDDGAAGGGGGGHFSGGGGGGGGSGCGGRDGGRGGTASTKAGTPAGGGGQSSCPGGAGGNGGQRGQWPLGRAPHCYDRSRAQGGNAGSSIRGGGGGDSCGNHYGGGGGGGGLQYGRKDLLKYLGMGAGGGGGGASAFPSPRAGRGGNGGGIVYLRLGKLKLDGKIVAKGVKGSCVGKSRHRSAPGGSGAGGSVAIFTNHLLLGGSKLVRNHISIGGGRPVKCGFGAGGGGGGGVGRFEVRRAIPKRTYTSH